MELSSGYILGVFDSGIPFAPYPSRNRVSVSAATVKMEKAAGEGATSDKTIPLFATADHEEKTTPVG